MTPEQVTAIVIAITGLLGAVGILIREVRALRGSLNGTLAELLSHATMAARKEGELAGRDYVRAEQKRAALLPGPPNPNPPGPKE